MLSPPGNLDDRRGGVLPARPLRLRVLRVLRASQMVMIPVAAIGILMALRVHRTGTLLPLTC
ncbi:hypothetical protein ACWIE7_14515 [Dietzia sp. NPDC055343]